jgi:PilZ domain
MTNVLTELETTKISANSFARAGFAQLEENARFRKPAKCRLRARLTERKRRDGEAWVTSLSTPGMFEHVFTGDVSETGARVLTTKRWEPGQSVIVSFPPESAAHARIVYCRRAPSDNFILGLSFTHSLQDSAGQPEPES